MQSGWSFFSCQQTSDESYEHALVSGLQVPTIGLYARKEWFNAMAYSAAADPIPHLVKRV